MKCVRNKKLNQVIRINMLCRYGSFVRNLESVDVDEAVIGVWLFIMSSVIGLCSR